MRSHVVCTSELLTKARNQFSLLLPPLLPVDLVFPAGAFPFLVHVVFPPTLKGEQISNQSLGQPKLVRTDIASNVVAIDFQWELDPVIDA